MQTMFAPILHAAIFSMSAMSLIAENSIPFFVGTYTKGNDPAASRGIYSASLNLDRGEVEHLTLIAEVMNPSFLAQHPTLDVVYAVVEASTFRGEPGGGIVALSQDPKSRNWTMISEESVGGKGPCHLAVDPAGRVVITANYNDGTVSVFPIEADGSLGPRSQLIQHDGSGPHPNRQKGPHAHGITFSPDGQFVCVPDLGMDQIMIYRLDKENARLSPADPAGVAMSPGAGPRHLAFAPDGMHAYSINELDNTITSFVWDATRGKLEPMEAVSTLPDGWVGKNSTAEIVVHPSGRFVLGSNRGHDSLAVFNRDSSTGRLSQLRVVPCGGTQPRSFAFSPDGRWVVVGNQATNSLTTFAFDPESGALTPTDFQTTVGAPVCILFE